MVIDWCVAAVHNENVETTLILGDVSTFRFVFESLASSGIHSTRVRRTMAAGNETRARCGRRMEHPVPSSPQPG